MAIKESPEKQTPPITYKASDRLIDEKDTLIEINQSLKGITWNDSEVPTLTSQAEEKSESVEVVQAAAEFSFDIIEDFLPESNTLNGHQPNCTCIKCQPKKVYESASPLASIPIEKGIKPLSKRRNT